MADASAAVITLECKDDEFHAAMAELAEHAANIDVELRERFLDFLQRTPDLLEVDQGTTPATRATYFIRPSQRERANVPYAAIQQLRRTGATYVERDRPGAAMRYLGHRTPGMAYRHYVDRSKLNDAIQPPDL